MDEKYYIEMPVIAASVVSSTDDESKIKFPKPLKYEEKDENDFYSHLCCDINKKLNYHAKHAVEVFGYGATDRERMAQMVDFCLENFASDCDLELNEEKVLKAAAESAITLAIMKN